MHTHGSVALLALLVCLAVAWPALTPPLAAANFVTHLSGDEEVPPRDTLAQGQAILRLSRDGTTLSYLLIVANIENVVAAHIHLGEVGVNGPIVAFLAGPFPPDGGRVDGILARGTVTAADLLGPLVGQPLSALVAAMQAGNTYVNVHTNDGVEPQNTGQGISQSARSVGRFKS